MQFPHALVQGAESEAGWKAVLQALAGRPEPELIQTTGEELRRACEERGADFLLRVAGRYPECRLDPLPGPMVLEIVSAALRRSLTLGKLDCFFAASLVGWLRERDPSIGLGAELWEGIERTVLGDEDRYSCLYVRLMEELAGRRGAVFLRGLERADQGLPEDRKETAWLQRVSLGLLVGEPVDEPTLDRFVHRAAELVWTGESSQAAEGARLWGRFARARSDGRARARRVCSELLSRWAGQEAMAFSEAFEALVGSIAEDEGERIGYLRQLIARLDVGGWPRDDRDCLLGGLFFDGLAGRDGRPEWAALGTALMELVERRVLGRRRARWSGSVYFAVRMAIAALAAAAGTMEMTEVQRRASTLLQTFRGFGDDDRLELVEDYQRVLQPVLGDWGHEEVLDVVAAGVQGNSEPARERLLRIVERASGGGDGAVA